MSAKTVAEYFQILVDTLLRRRLSDRTPEFGKALEHFLVLETIAAQSYGTALERLNYWRSSSGYEVDLLLNGEIAVKFKSGPIHSSDAKGLVALGEEP